jgi:hypothetical protein
MRPPPTSWDRWLLLAIVIIGVAVAFWFGLRE